MAIVTASGNRIGPMPARGCRNFFEVAPNALHPLELTLDDDVRPVACAGLAAIRRAADGSSSFFSTPTLQPKRTL